MNEAVKDSLFGLVGLAVPALFINFMTFGTSPEAVLVGVGAACFAGYVYRAHSSRKPEAVLNTSKPYYDKDVIESLKAQTPVEFMKIHIPLPKAKVKVKANPKLRRLLTEPSVIDKANAGVPTVNKSGKGRSKKARKSGKVAKKRSNV